MTDFFVCLRRVVALLALFGGLALHAMPTHAVAPELLRDLALGENEAKVKATAIQRFVDDLKDLKGSAVAAEPPGDVARFGLGAPALRITVSDKAGKPVGTVLAAKQDAKYYVMREAGGTVFETR